MIKNISNIIILSDMDGTFLPSSKKPSQVVLDALDKYQANGGRFSIATGRALQAADQYFDTIKVNFPAILCNGGHIYDIQKAKSKMSIFVPDNTRSITAQILSEHPSAGCEVLTLDKVYVPQMNDCEREHNDICQVVPTLCSIDEIPRNWYKVLFADYPENIDKLMKYVESQNFSGVDFVRSSDNYYEILPQNISKGYAVDFIRKNYAKENDVIICMGDYFNDMEMLKRADIAVCPSNAVDEIKDICDIVLDKSCEQDAFAELIDIIFENPNYIFGGI